jgi:LPPG:FO 2-phospho-L-lactate transferase
MITVLTGGTGGAKLVDGLRRVVPQRDLTIIVNTGDDFEWWGLNISPDIDSVTYVLADLLSKERGWGVQDDTFLCLERMKSMGEPAWFQIGDRDLALHLIRTRLIREGKTLAEASAEISRKLGIEATILPMTNDSVATVIETPAGEISFQEYFVKRHYQDEVKSVRFAGAERARPAARVREAILSAGMVLIAPSNPVTSIGPILAVPGIRDALRETSAPIAAVSPIVGGGAVSGPAGALMAACGVPVSLAGLARAYEDFLDVLIADSRDEQQTCELTTPALRVHWTNVVMKNDSDRMRLAKSVLGFISQGGAANASVSAGSLAG